MGIVAVWGPASSGKTTLAIDLAFALSRRDKSVCLISAEAYSELSARMQLQITKANSLTAAYQQPGALHQIVCKAEELLYVLAVPIGNDVFSQEESSRAVKELLKQARSFFDHVLVDCTSGAGSGLSAWAMRMADNVLLMIGGRTRDGEWHKSYRRAVWEVKAKAEYICAEVNPNFDYASLFSLIGIEPRHRLPHIPDAEWIQQSRRTLYGMGGSGAARRRSKAYTAIVDEICSILEVKHD